jgi:hypothetical protein
MKTIQENYNSPIKDKLGYANENVPSFLMTPTKKEYKNQNETPVKNRKNLHSI